MERFSQSNRAKGRVGPFRPVFALLAVALLAAGQGVEHSHATAPDAAQCAVCHVGRVEPAPVPVVATRIPSTFMFTEPPAPGLAPASGAPDGAPPVRGPPLPL